MDRLHNLKTFRLGYSIFCFRFASKTRGFVVGGSNPSNFSIQNQLLCRQISSEISSSQHNFTVSYLINSCGLSPEGAISASKWVELHSPERPEVVLAFLRNHGFSPTQISRLVRSFPRILLANTQKTILPKLEVYRSLGISREDLAKALASNPCLLSISLRKRILPTCNFLKSMLSEKKVASVFKRNSRIFYVNRSITVVPNIGLLEKLGMPQSCISLLLAYYPVVLMANHEKFCQVVDEVKGMGFNLGKSTSVAALRALCGGNKLIWKRSCEVFRRLGWSEDDIFSAFRKNPQCMIVSEKKLLLAIDLLENKMGWSSAMIAKYPVVLSLSLERRLIPRCQVIKVLLSKGLINENLNLGSVLRPVQKEFMERFVTKYAEEVPQLSKVYERKVDIQDV